MFYRDHLCPRFMSEHKWSGRTCHAASGPPTQLVPLDQLWLPWIVRFATSVPPINIKCAGLLQVPSTDLGRSVYALPKRLTGCWLEATR